jgi:hypothetical protein
MDNKRPSGGAPEPPAKRQEMEFDDDMIEEEEDLGWQGPPDEAADVELGEAGRNWTRPDPAPIDLAKDKIRK